MKKAVKIILAMILSVAILIFGVIFSLYLITPNKKLDLDKLINFERSVVFYDQNNSVIQEESNGKSITKIENIPIYTQKAFVAIEDKRFYSHNGVDYKGLCRAILNNIRSFSFKEGASTISQQLIKNTHLSSEKTLKRKLLEMRLSRKLEKQFSKDEILEKYLNTIYFGDNCYGILSASKYYFNKLPQELDLNESAMLAGIIKAPSNYSPYANFNKCMSRKDLVLKQMCLQGFINKDEFDNSFNKEVELYQKNNDEIKYHNYITMAKKEFNVITKLYPYSNRLNVYTYCDSEIQNHITKELKNNSENAYKSALLLNKDSTVVAYYSNFGDNPRQLGSTIKPLISYAPAIEENIVYSISKITDEKTNFNGFCPKNYNDKYYGDISVKEALSKSSNICAIKLLNSVGISKAKKYLEILDIPLTENDNSLCLALGATEKGAKLSQITNAYCVFNNDGYVSRPSFINYITDDSGKIIYKNNQKKTKVFNDDTISIMNDMQRETVINGTAKKLSFANTTLYAKTGTVGNEKGNTDAYSISYNSDYVLGVWLGNKEKTYLTNNVSGGGLPTLMSKTIWDSIYKEKTSKLIEPKNVCEVFIDRISYEKDNQIVLAENYCPNRYKIKILTKNNFIPRQISTRFSNPKIESAEISINHNEINIRLCLAEYYNAKIYRAENNKKIEIYDTKNKDKNLFVDKSCLANKYYVYSVVPYFEDNGKICYGEEIFLKKIKSPSIIIDGDWWNE